MVFKSVNFEEQIEILKSRNMYFKYEKKAQETIRYISYYKIKEFAEPFATKKERENAPTVLDYNGVFFERIISRYYQDKNFRLHILHAIEDIEVALQTQIAYVLGESVGDYGYLEFKNWADISNNSKDEIKKQEERLKSILTNQIRISNKSELTEKLKYGQNQNYPPVWLAMNELMFGQLIQLLIVMSRKNLSKISKYFNCTNAELISWMKCLNLVRNISAHNSNLIDLKLRTTPITRKEWNAHLYKYDKHVYTNRVSVPIVILSYLMNQINPKYKFGNISTALQNLIQYEVNTANYLGFKSINTIQSIFPVQKERTKKRSKKITKKGFNPKKRHTH